MTDLIRGASKMTDLIEYRSYYADCNVTKRLSVSLPFVALTLELG